MSTPDSTVAIFRVVDAGGLASLELRVASFGAAAMLGELVAGQQVELRLVPVEAVQPVASESAEAGR